MDMRAQKAEIDLLDIAVSTVQSVTKNLTWVILITLSGGIGGYLTSKFSSAYESQIMIKARRVQNTELAFLLLNYQENGVPGITKEEASDNVRKFSFIVNVDNALPGEKKLQSESFATITVALKDSALFQKIQAGLTARLNNEKLVRNYYATDNEINSKLIAQYKERIRRAEALIERKSSDESVVLFPEIMTMTTRLAEIEAVFEKPMVTAIDDFEPIRKQLNPVMSVIVGLLIGMILSAVFIGVRSFASYYKKVTAGT
jgi:hypothetical protein